MTDESSVPTPEEDAYAMYEALTDARDEAELLAQEAEGQPVGDVWEERRRELDELRPLLGLGDLVAEQEAER
jgi:hypothetical protein